MAHAIAHVIEYRARIMHAAIWAAYALPYAEEKAAIAAAEQAAGFKHGWFYDEMAGACFQNDGGRGIVWVDQPVMD